MTTLPKYLILSALFLVSLSGPGCGQKGPLYIPEERDGQIEHVEPKDDKTLKELKDLEEENQSQPAITY